MFPPLLERRTYFEMKKPRREGFHRGFAENPRRRSPRDLIIIAIGTTIGTWTDINSRRGVWTSIATRNTPASSVRRTNPLKAQRAFAIP